MAHELQYETISGKILLVGKEGEEAALAVSIARGWPMTELARLEDVPQQAGNEPGSVLVVAPSRLLKVRLLIEIARRMALDAPAVSLGYLSGDNSEKLSRAAQNMLRWSKDAQPPEQTVRVVNMLRSRHPVKAAGLVDLHERLQTPNAVIETLSMPSELDILIGHSNGCDLGLGGVIYCRRPSESDASPSELRVMPCFQGGVCSRQAANKGIVTSADSSGARRVIAACCWGVTLDESLFSSRYSIGAALLQHAGVESMLAVLRATGFETPELLQMYHYAAVGAPFGTIASLANRLRIRAGLAPEWMCFGDPASHLNGRLTEAPIEPDNEQADLFKITIPAGLALPADIYGVLPTELLPLEPIVLVDSEAVTAGAISPDGMLFLTVEREATRELTLRITDRTSLDGAVDFAARLRSGLDFVDVLLLGPLSGMLPELTEACRLAVAQFRKVLAGWGLAKVPIGSVLSEESIRKELALLAYCARNFGSAFIELIAVYAARAGCMQSGLWAWAYHEAGANEDAGRCPHCRGVVAETAMQSLTGQDRRSIAFCDACGFLYDGDPEVARWLEGPYTTAPGQILTLRLAVRNPYGFRVPVAAIAVFDRHETSGSIIVRKEFDDLAAREERNLVLDIEVPAGATPGVNYVGAGLVVGTRTSCYQRPVFVQRRKEGAG
jgi:hypothetical protein